MNPSEPDKLILIGASTGGPGHISKILESLKPGMKAAVIIAQHMGHAYVPSFVKQLNENCIYPVQQAVDNKPLQASHIYITSLKTKVSKSQGRLIFQQQNDTSLKYNPDINVLFISVSVLELGKRVLGIILTGIGDDGSEGCKILFEKGAKCIAESEESAIVDGMPMQTRKKVPEILALDINSIINQINIFSA